MIIDPPSVFAPLTEWEAFRDSMEVLASEYPDNADVRDALKNARDEVARLTV